MALLDERCIIRLPGEQEGRNRVVDGVTRLGTGGIACDRIVDSILDGERDSASDR